MKRFWTPMRVILAVTGERTVAHAFTNDTLNFDQQVEPNKAAELTGKVDTETRYELCEQATNRRATP